MAFASTLRIAWRSLGRNLKRSVLVAGAIAVGQIAFIATAGLMHGYAEQFISSATGPAVGHAQVHAQEWREDRAIDLVIPDVQSKLAEILEDEDVEHVSARIYAPALAALTEDGFMSVVVGIDPASESHPAGLLAGLEMVPNLGEHQVLVGRGLAVRHGIEPGTELAIIGQDVDGSIASDMYVVADVIASSVEIVNSFGIVMSLGDAQELLLIPGQAHEITIHLKDRDLADQAVQRLSSLPSLSGLELKTWLELAPIVMIMVRFIENFSYIVLAIVFVAAAAGITNTMLMSTFERTHEFGMLLSLGCGPGRISRMIAVEAAILGLVGVVAGTVLGLWLIALPGESGFDYAAFAGLESTYEVAFQGVVLSSIVYPRICVSDVVVAVAVVLVTSFAAVVWPTLHIMRLEPVEAMRS